MDSNKESHAQNVKLKCRVCRKEIDRKNYKSHLQTGHPKKATKVKTVEISDQETETSAVDDLDNVIGAEDIESKERKT